MRQVEGLRGAAMVTSGGSVAAELAEGLADAEAGVGCSPGPGVPDLPMTPNRAVVARHGSLAFVLSLKPVAMELVLGQVRAFVEVARQMHFGQAAGRLFLTQQGVSKRIQQLERTIGEPLFARGPRGVELTMAGQRFLPSAQQLVTAADAAARTTSPPPAGGLEHVHRDRHFHPAAGAPAPTPPPARTEAQFHGRPAAVALPGRHGRYAPYPTGATGSGPRTRRRSPHGNRPTHRPAQR